MSAEEMQSYRDLVLENIEYDHLCREAITKGADARKLFAIPSREQIGRAKSVSVEEYPKVYEEIAAEMDVTVKSVEFEVSKAMKILRVALKDYLAFFIFWFYIN